MWGETRSTHAARQRKSGSFRTASNYHQSSSTVPDSLLASSLPFLDFPWGSIFSLNTHDSQIPSSSHYGAQFSAWSIHCLAIWLAIRTSEAWECIETRERIQGYCGNCGWHTFRRSSTFNWAPAAEVLQWQEKTPHGRDVIRHSGNRNSNLRFWPLSWILQWPVIVERISSSREVYWQSVWNCRRRNLHFQPEKRQDQDHRQDSCDKKRKKCTHVDWGTGLQHQTFETTCQDWELLCQNEVICGGIQEVQAFLGSWKVKHWVSNCDSCSM